MIDFDWNQLRGFLATADTGSLSAAARKLGLTQPTLSRQVAALEAELGVTLFERLGKRLALTDTGLELLEHARQMGSAADKFALSATGRSQTVEGLVSISASDMIAVHILPSIMHIIRAEAPGIRIEVIASNALSDLRRREADIAIRHVRPEEPELFAKFVRQAQAYFYASEGWVALHGMPHTPDDLRGRDFIGIQQDSQFVDYLVGLGFPMPEIGLPMHSESSLVVWEMVKRGLGVCAMMTEIGEATPGVVRVLTAAPSIDFPIWLVTHRELHTNRRIRIVFDILAHGLVNAKS